MSDITPAMVNRLSWKDGEYHYVVSLMRSRGNRNVPRDAVLSYLALQSKSAADDGEMPISIALFGAHTLLSDGNLSLEAFERAFVWLVEQREKLATA